MYKWGFSFQIDQEDSLLMEDRMNRSLLIVIFFITLLTCSATLALERVPGTKISMNPPDGFTITSRFSGFFHQETTSSIMINELPAPFAEIAKGFTEKGLNSQGMSLIEKSAVTFGTHPALLALVKQNASGNVFFKWILLFGDEENTEMLVAVFPDNAPSEWSKQLKNTLLTSRWHKDLDLDLFDGLHYRVEGHGDIKIAKKISNMLLLTKNGVIPNQPSGEPKVIISPSVSMDWQAPKDKLNYTLNRLQQMTSLCESPKTLSKQSITYDSLDGYQLEASCKHIKTGEQLFVLHTMIYSDHGYYVLNASVNHQQKQTYQPVFEHIFRSFKRL
jgi:hypothetical protein